MTRVYLMRHGNAYDENGFQTNDSPLKGYGLAQVEKLARRLKDCNIGVAYSSPYERAKQTALIFSKFSNLPIKQDSRLKEVGTEEWPNPGTFDSKKTLRDFEKTQDYVEDVFLEIVARHKNTVVALFTHGNWIRTLLTRILKIDVNSFGRIVIGLASITILDVDDNGTVWVTTVSDGAHNFLL